MKLFFILGGGALGSLFRYMLSGVFQHDRFPLGTMIVNAAGCFLIGLMVPLIERGYFGHPEIKSFILIGFLGAFTTFSTFAFETFNLIEGGKLETAAMNILIQVVSGIVLVFVGIIIGRSFYA